MTLRTAAMSAPNLSLERLVLKMIFDVRIFKNLVSVFCFHFLLQNNAKVQRHKIKFHSSFSIE